MGLIPSVFGQDGADPSDEDVTDGAPAEAGTAGGTDGGSGRGRRLLLVAAVVGGVALAVYLRSRRKRLRESEFTEIELEPASPTPGEETE